MPSMAAYATSRSAKESELQEVHYCQVMVRSWLVQVIVSWTVGGCQARL